MSSIDHSQILSHYRPTNLPSIYSIGAFSSGVTVRSQQIRALNLAYTLIEQEELSICAKNTRKIAVVGAGFSGLTFVAALLKKEIACSITLFEEHDTLLPLQQGSDSRWLHPHIYEWPDRGSEADVAMLPLMNWTAARASDVVVQVLREWKQTATSNDKVTLYCNTRHIHLTKDDDNPTSCRIEWIGEPRNPLDGTIRQSTPLAQGDSDKFDLAVLAVGFGIEKETSSYWRNEIIGQPLLNQSRRTYLISGQGDGALIDLVRVRLSQYRQDRILEEMFFEKNEILKRLSAAKRKHSGGKSTSLFDDFDQIFLHDEECKHESKEVLGLISRRLRRDTDAILRIKVPDIATLLCEDTSRISFQNALLTYLLYRVGGFAPSCDQEEAIVAKYSIPEDFIVRRHGTDRGNQLRRVCPSLDIDSIEERSKAERDVSEHVSKILWPGGYFDHPGPSSERDKINDDEVRSRWRKEYLPGPTTLVTATICSSLVGAIQNIFPDLGHLRVTMHRVLLLNDDQLLQQTCDYEGLSIPEEESTRGRTFLANNAMIGLAYGSHQPVHTRKGVSPEEIARTMATLGLHEAARNMAPEVSYVLALPILQPESSYFRPSRVAAIVYLDSKDRNFSMKASDVIRVAKVVDKAASGLAVQSKRMLLGVRNIPFTELSSNKQVPQEERKDVTDVIEYLPTDIAPILNQPFVMNFDYADPASTGQVNLVAEQC